MSLKKKRDFTASELLNKAEDDDDEVTEKAMKILLDRIKRFVKKDDNKKFKNMITFKKLLKVNDYEIEEEPPVIKKDSMYINYLVNSKINDEVETIGVLTGKIPKYRWDEFKEKYEENFNLKVLD